MTGRKLIVGLAVVLSGLALGLLFGAIAARADNLAEGTILQVSVTYYLPTGSRTANGDVPHWGTAGCSSRFPFGTVLQFENGLTVTCDDRGYDEWMVTCTGCPPDGHIDVFCDRGESYCMQEIPGVSYWRDPQSVVVMHWGP